MSQLACCKKKQDGDRDDTETDPRSTREIQHSIFFNFPFLRRSLLFSTTETELGPIWFGFSMNYHGLDPVSAVKAPKMSQLYPYPAYEYSTTCSHLSIVFSFVLVSDSSGDSVLEGEEVAKREVALIYDSIVGTAAATARLDVLKGGSSPRA